MTAPSPPASAASNWRYSNPGTFINLRLVLVTVALGVLINFYLRRRRQTKLDEAYGAQHGCKPVVPRVPYKWPLAIDLFKIQYDALRSGHTLEAFSKYINIEGTIKFEVFGGSGLIINDPKNIEAILSTHFEDYGLGSRRIGALPLLGEGIFTQDGTAWQHSRELIRRQFVRVQKQNLRDFTAHVDELVSALADAAVDSDTVVNMQPYFTEFTLGTTTQLLFGEPHSVLPKADRDALRESFDYASQIFGIRLRLADLAPLYNPPKFKKACKIVRDWATFFSDKAMRYKDTFGEEKAFDKYSFLVDLWREMRDEGLVRDQLLHILIAGRDTTAATIGWTFFHLVRNPDILARLKKEVADVPRDEHVTREMIAKLPYLRCCLNETLRLYPQLAVNVRFAVKTTMLPQGGGPDGRSPVLIPRGTGVGWSTYHLHRLESIYGKDARVYRPERWEDGELIKKAGLGGYVDFNAGPRICLGKNFALMEISYAIIRILQAFPNIRLPPGEQNLPVGQELQDLSIILFPGEGVKVQLK